jgi:hypothetical protein
VLFNSYVFVFVFLPLALGVYALVRRLPSAQVAVGWLIVASLVYYAWWKPIFVFLVLGSIAANAAFGHALLRGRLSAGRKKATLIAGLVFNLGVLASSVPNDWVIA